ncbi:MAG: PAS domain S-box protein [Anaerolineae bacterium]|nr:PAS domain S-box protein [Anaerolineae bacterium]
MDNRKKTKEQLIQELTSAHAQIAKLETVVSQLEQIQDASFKAQFSIDHAPEGVSWVQADGSFAYVNDTMCNIMGYSREELLAMSVFDIDPLMTKEMWPGIWQRVRENKIPLHKTQHRTKDGRIIPVEIVANYLKYEGQEYNCTFILDLTERKRAEAALRDSEERQRQILEAVPTGMSITRMTDGVLLYANEQFGAMFGKPVAELIGMRILDFYYDPDDRVPLLAALREKGALKDYEMRMKRLDNGRMFWVNMATQFFIFNGEQTLLVASADITTRKKAEAKHEHLQQEIIKAQQQAIAELATPVIPIMDRIIVMPLMGNIDSLRARDITRNLLAGIRQHRAKVVILDVTGVGLMDTGIVNHLNKTIQAARLKGAQTIVTGLSDAVAEAIVDLGIDWSGVETLSDLQTGLMMALNRLGMVLSSRDLSNLSQ